MKSELIGVRIVCRLPKMVRLCERNAGLGYSDLTAEQAKKIMYDRSTWREYAWGALPNDESRLWWDVTAYKPPLLEHVSISEFCLTVGCRPKWHKGASYSSLFSVALMHENCKFRNMVEIWWFAWWVIDNLYLSVAPYCFVGE